MSRVLIVDDEASICWAFREYLGELGHEVDVAATAEEGLRIVGETEPDAVVVDIRLPGMDGLSAMRAFRDRLGQVPIVVITAFGNLETAVRAMQGGAFDYLVKPFDLDQAAGVIDRALEAGRKVAVRRVEAIDRDPTSELVGDSPPMQELFKQIALVAQSEVPVMITGESGAGKEMVARAIHQHSSRGSRTFLPVCLAALSPSLIEGELFGHIRGSFTGAVQDRKGLLELAGGGTVLLDEIGDVPVALQVKLLRAIEHREVTPVGDARPRPINVRFLAATNRPLGELMASGQFREDLFFRLSVFPIRVPSLRERREDIPILARHFLDEVHGSSGGHISLRDDVTRELMNRPWVGNVRELRNAIEHAAILARDRDIRVEHLPIPSIPATQVGGNPPRDLEGKIAAWTEAELHRSESDAESAPSLYERFLELVEPPLIRTVLDQEEGNKALTARRIGIHRATLRQKLRRYGLE